MDKPANDKPRTVIIAELSANHGGDFEKALALIDAAKWAGADMVKAQYFTPEQMCLDDGVKIPDGPWSGKTLFELYREAMTPAAWIPQLAAYVHSVGMKFGCSVYHPDAVPFVAQHADALKIASFEIRYDDLLRAAAAAGKPVLIATGAANLNDLTRAVELFKGKEMALLKCTSAYPAPLDQMNLLTIPDMIRRFGIPIGLSDHSIGCLAAVLSVAWGGSIIEKHLKLDDGCLDAAFSATPNEFRIMAETVRAAEQAMGAVSYRPTTKKYVRRKVGDRWVRTVN